MRIRSSFGEPHGYSIGRSFRGFPCAVMNLGQVIGLAYLRIAELEERLAGGPVRRKRRGVGPRPEPGKRYLGVLASVRAILAASDRALTADQIWERMPNVPRIIIARNLRVATCRDEFVREGNGLEAKYRLPERRAA